MKKYFKIIAASIIAFAATFGFAEEKEEATLNEKILRLCSIKSANSYPVATIPHPETWRPKIALALSGGGARGFSQIGVLKTFDSAEIPIDYIVGTSVGAIVGGLYSIGYETDVLDSIAVNSDWERLVYLSEESERSDLFLDQKLIEDRNLLTLRFDDFEFITPEAISTGTRFRSFLQNLIWNGEYKDSDFINLKIPFVAAATDLVSGETVVLDSGSLSKSIRASFAIPLRFSPVRIDSQILVDGGLMANIPAAQAEKSGSDLVVSVNTISPLLKPNDLNKPWNVADQVVSVLMKRFSDKASSDADFSIKPDIGLHHAGDFSGLDSLIIKGEIAARKALPKIKRKYYEKIDSTFYLRFFTKLLRSETAYTSGVLINGFNENDSLIITKAFRGYAGKVKQINDALKKIALKGVYKYIELEFLKNGDVLKCRAEPFPKINKIQTKGLNGEEAQELNSLLNAKFSGTFLSPSVVRSAIETTLSSLRNLGYSFADVEDFIFDSTDGVLNLFLSKGIIKKIKIKGTNANDFLILRELKFKAGEAANANKILESWKNLQNVDYARDVEISIREAKNGEGLAIIIEVDDLGNQSIRIGGRIDNERYAQLGVDLTQENVFNVGARVSLRLAGGERNQFVSLQAENSRIFNSMLTGSYSIYYDRTIDRQYQKNRQAPRNKIKYINVSDLVEERIGAKASFGAQLERKGTLKAELRYERQRFWETETSVGRGYYNILTLKLGTIFDSEDKANFPTIGERVNIFLETSPPAGADFVNFSKAEFSYKSNYSIDNFTVIPSVFFGFADETAPLPEFYSVGGQEDFFGMRENWQRGRQKAVGSFALRYKAPFQIFFDSYFSLRYDLGSVWENFEKIRFGDLKHGLGISAALDTPLGPAKFSLGRGFRLLKNPNSIAWGSFKGYFSIGMEL